MTSRIIAFRRLVWFGLALIIVRLVYLQLVHGAMYRDLSDKNRLRLVPELAPRGLLLDRHNQTIATNELVFRVAAIPQDVRDTRVLFTSLSPLVGVPAAELDWRLDERATVPFQPATLVKRVTKTVALRVEEARWSLPGIVVEPVMTRRYPLGAVGAHLVGYLSQPSAEMYPKLKPYGVTPHDLVGRSGLERELDSYLRGRSGGSMVEVDSRARQVRVMGRREPEAGKPVSLTVDAKLASRIQAEFDQFKQAGAAVVLNPQTGEILAMVSAPSFDPTAFVERDSKTIQRYLDDPKSPLMNRATMGVYLPGSIIKAVVGGVALEERLITPATTATCGGFYQIGDRKIHCWNRDGHGTVDLRGALAGSCNIYFLDIAKRMGLDRLRRGFEDVGIGKRTGWPLEERSGRMPGSRRLSLGEVAMLGIGQGDILVTPLQMAVIAGAIGNEGWVVEPWAVKAIDAYPVKHAKGHSLGWSKSTLEAIRQGMFAVVNDAHGTGFRARNTRITVAGKTGTAQTHAADRASAPHGWFMGYCPAEKPVAAIAVVAEHGGSGGDLPAHIGGIICTHIADELLGPAPAPQSVQGTGAPDAAG